MSKVSVYPPAASIAGTDVFLAVVGGATNRVPVSLVQQATLAAMLPFDVPPLTPHAKDDEFIGVALDVKWTNPANSAANHGVDVTVAGGWMSLEPTTAGAASTGLRGVFGIRQTAPPAGFTVTARIEDLLPGRTDKAFAGLYVGINTGKAWINGIVNDAVSLDVAYALGVATAPDNADWGAFDATQINVEVKYSLLSANQGKWFKIVHTVVAGGTLTFWYSLDGVIWTQQGGAIVTGVQPNRIGLGLWDTGAGVFANHKMGANWFRVTEP